MYRFKILTRFADADFPPCQFPVSSLLLCVSSSLSVSSTVPMEEMQLQPTPPRPLLWTLAQQS